MGTAQQQPQRGAPHVVVATGVTEAAIAATNHTRPRRITHRLGVVVAAVEYSAVVQSHAGRAPVHQ